MKTVARKRARRTAQSAAAGPKTSPAPAFAGEHSFRSVPDMWALRSPEARAQMIERWAGSHRDGADLSDWAVSRDSIYD